MTTRGSKKVLARRGSNRVNSISNNNEKLQYTVAVCCSANGVYLPHYILFKSKHLYDKWIEKAPSNFCFNTSPSGWMEELQFKAWFENVFIKHTRSLTPKLLILDGHSSHLSIDVIRSARAYNIHVICLPPHSTHTLQPLDVSVFKPLKTAWKGVLKNYFLKNNFSDIDKEKFVELLEETRTHAV